MGFSQSLIEKYSIAVSVETVLHFRPFIPAICHSPTLEVILAAGEQGEGCRGYLSPSAAAVCFPVLPQQVQVGGCKIG